jgi:hypothetical protein
MVDPQKPAETVIYWEHRNRIFLYYLSQLPTIITPDNTILLPSDRNSRFALVTAGLRFLGCFIRDVVVELCLGTGTAMRGVHPTDSNRSDTDSDLVEQVNDSIFLTRTVFFGRC